MKRFALAIILGVLITLLSIGYFFKYRTKYDDEPRSLPQPNTSNEIIKFIEREKPEVRDTLTDIKTKPLELFADEYDNDSAMKTWKEAYADFLSSYSGVIDYDISEFSLRDLDNNGSPELIIIQTGTGIEGVLTTYSYDENVYEIGNYSNSKIGVAGLGISKDSKYPGLFTCWWGGGVEHYGYLVVMEEKLIYEDLWYDDHTMEESQSRVEISSDKQLIEESINAHPPYEYTDNILEMYIINKDNINKIIK